jgi:hypothetical protein
MWIFVALFWPQFRQKPLKNLRLTCENQKLNTAANQTITLNFRNTNILQNQIYRLIYDFTMNVQFEHVFYAYIDTF